MKTHRIKKEGKEMELKKFRVYCNYYVEAKDQKEAEELANKITEELVSNMPFPWWEIINEKRTKESISIKDRW